MGDRGIRISEKRTTHVFLTPATIEMHNFFSEKNSTWELTTIVVLRLGDAWLVGVGKRAPHWFRCPCLISPHGSLDRLKHFTYIVSSTLNSIRQTKQALGTRSRRAEHVEQIKQVKSEMCGVLLGPSSSHTLRPMYDVVGVNLTCNVT